MDEGVDFAWLSLLQKRADYARKAAASARTEFLAEELQEMAAFYDGIAGRAEANAARAALDKSVVRSDPKVALIKHLQTKSHEFLSKARTVKDKKRADELKYLSGAYGAEAARVKNDGLR